MNHRRKEFIKKSGLINFVQISFIFLLLANSCEKDNDISEIKFEPFISENPVARGNRILGFTPHTTDDSWLVYDESFNQDLTRIASTGAEVVDLNESWADIENSRGVYHSDGLDALLKYCPPKSLKLTLSLGAVDISDEEKLPEYLKGKTLDDPEVISAYKLFIDWVFDTKLNVVDAEIYIFSVGNEVDDFINDDTRFDQFKVFLKEIIPYVKMKDPGMIVGIKGIHAGITGSLNNKFRELFVLCDAVMITYYPVQLSDFTIKKPLSSVLTTDFRKIATFSSELGKKCYFLEAGLPSSTICNSSENDQAEFIHYLFKNWDSNLDDIPFINIWSYKDGSAGYINSWRSAYKGLPESFFEYLRSLGLNDITGKEKPAMIQLKAELESRAWN